MLPNDRLSKRLLFGCLLDEREVPRLLACRLVTAYAADLKAVGIDRGTWLQRCNACDGKTWWRAVVFNCAIWYTPRQPRSTGSCGPRGGSLDPPLTSGKSLSGKISQQQRLDHAVDRIASVRDDSFFLAWEFRLVVKLLFMRLATGLTPRRIPGKRRPPAWTLAAAPSGANERCRRLLLLLRWIVTRLMVPLFVRSLDVVLGTLPKAGWPTMFYPLTLRLLFETRWFQP